MCGVGKRHSIYFDEVSNEIFHGFLRKSLIAFRLYKTCLFWFPVVTTALLLLKGKGPIEETRYVIWHGMQGFSYCEGGTRKKVSLVHSTKMIFLSLRFVWSRQRLKVTKKVTAFFTLFYYLKEVPSLTFILPLFSCLQTFLANYFIYREIVSI